MIRLKFLQAAHVCGQDYKQNQIVEVSDQLAEKFELDDHFVSLFNAGLVVNADEAPKAAEKVDVSKSNLTKKEQEVVQSILDKAEQKSSEKAEEVVSEEKADEIQDHEESVEEADSEEQGEVLESDESEETESSEESSESDEQAPEKKKVKSKKKKSKR